jgi:integrase
VAFRIELSAFLQPIFVWLIGVSTHRSVSVLRSIVRDATLILTAFRHGLRATEICDLEWSQVEFGRSASLHVRRAKNGKPSVHLLRSVTNCGRCASCGKRSD